MMRATIYIWTLGLGLLTVDAYHDRTIAGTTRAKQEPMLESIASAQKVLGGTADSCYVCSSPCSRAVCCHGEFPQCCSDGVYCYCCQD
ncbi:hypothetical protein ASPTUDRAFT_61820 [Aspergillus tubingensis CBS 134.48]|uniref:Granulins domain-containing protein n=1 Tax=Aspergillus tubingensis (strain CBS 134.48) TaxID=767770 RepID=A0A1L9NEU8_ASPTC|nr:hypothetical protein ASPTUDRAFT_61820 [Aspergillus tubingensis CBS 134.48]